MASERKPKWITNHCGIWPVLELDTVETEPVSRLRESTYIPSEAAERLSTRVLEILMLIPASAGERGKE